MSKLLRVVLYLGILAAIGVITFGVVYFVFSGKQDSSELDSVEKPLDPVEEITGMWGATSEQINKSNYSYTADKLNTSYYFHFKKNGVILTRGIVLMNGKLLSDTDWVIANATWHLDGNVIVFSNGKQFVIDEGHFDDLHDGQVLHYRKLTPTEYPK